MIKYLVGGAVRNYLLNLPIKDRDYVIVGATEKELLDNGYEQVGKGFPVYLAPISKEECALARKEIKTGNNYTGFSFDFSPNVTLREDLQRRDFTINALCLNLETCEVIDLVGGIPDLISGVIRAINPTGFIEDSVRILRGCRIAAELDFIIEENTLNLMSKNIKELLNEPKERIWGELEKALNAKNPARFFLYLDMCGALEILFPELFKMKHVAQPESFHGDCDAFQHTLASIEYVSYLTKDPITRFAVLTHDFGKAETPKETLPHHHSHEKFGLPIIEQFCDRVGVPNKYRDFALLFCKYHLYPRDARKLNAKTIVKLMHDLKIYHKESCLYDKFILASRGDVKPISGSFLETHINRTMHTLKNIMFFDACKQALLNINYEEHAKKGYKKRHFLDIIHKEKLNEIREVIKKFKETTK